MVEWPDKVYSVDRKYIGAVGLQRNGREETYLIFDASTEIRNTIIAVRPSWEMPEGRQWANVDIAGYIKSREPEPVLPSGELRIVENLYRDESTPSSLEAALRFFMAMKDTSATRVCSAMLNKT